MDPTEATAVSHSILNFLLDVSSQNIFFFLNQFYTNLISVNWKKQLENINLIFTLYVLKCYVEFIDSGF